MKNFLIATASVALLAACAGPKYSYHFDRYDYNSGKKAKEAEQARLAAEQVELSQVQAGTSPLVHSPAGVSASNEAAPSIAASSATAAPDKGVFEKKYTEMSKSERREFRKALRSEMKNLAEAKKSGDHGSTLAATKVMDHDLKLAIIFGAVAITLSFFGGVNSVFWILSVVSLVVAVVFFIKWLAEQ